MRIIYTAHAGRQSEQNLIPSTAMQSAASRFWKITKAATSNKN